MSENTSAFSPCGTFFSSIGKDGKIRIWDASSDTLLREYIPDKHLSAPITCLKWITSKTGKRKSQADTSMSQSLLVFGTTSGHLLVYNLSLSRLVSNFPTKTGSKIHCLAWCEVTAQDVYTFSDNKYVSVWNISSNEVKNLWRINKAKIKAIALSQDSTHLITASNAISVWNIENKSILKSFIGHINNITSVHCVGQSNDMYIISASQGDRMLSVWSMKAKDQTAIANFKTDEPVTSISLSNTNGQTSLVAVNNCGALHYFTHQLNGKCVKPIDAKTSLHIYKDKEQTQLVNIMSAHVCLDNQILVAYGSGYLLSFDKIDLRHTTGKGKDKLVKLVREDKINNLIKKNKETQESKSNFKTKAADTSDAVYSFGGAHLTNGDVKVPSSPMSNLKRKTDQSGLVMEDRLKNLILEKPDQAGLASLQSDGLTQLLIQGLNSKDKTILDTVLLNRKDSVIENTVRGLPPQYLTPLLQEVVKNVQKSFIRHSSLKWLRYTVLCHTAILQSHPDAIHLFLPLLTHIESRSGTILDLTRLNGRLSLLFEQITRASEQSTVGIMDQSKKGAPSSALLDYQDRDSDEDNSDNLMLGIENDGNSDDNDTDGGVWEEMSDNDDEDEDNDNEANGDNKEDQMSVDEDEVDSDDEDEEENGKEDEEEEDDESDEDEDDE
uniref:WD repeat-containing protein 43 n=1 Tax=Cacopsylla melanoneura TaxID=428564 RepID=A0A8D8VK40_9HEMI